MVSRFAPQHGQRYDSARKREIRRPSGPFTAQGSKVVGFSGSVRTGQDEAVKQTTLKAPVRCAGIGLHTGAPVEMVLHPAPAGHGVVFRRTDLAGRENLVPARFDFVTGTRLGTVVANDAGAEVRTVEHLMAALAGLGIDNVLIDVSGPEVPVMDGSSAHFVDAILAAGVRVLPAARQVIRILKPVRVTDGDKMAELLPHPEFVIDFLIDFDADDIGRQRLRAEITPEVFAGEIARARTFGFFHEVEGLHAMGLARGGSMENVVVLKDGRVLNEDGLRFRDEFVRHKILDAVGDLALAGLPIHGLMKATRSGHELNNRLLRALFDQPDAYETVTLGAIRRQPDAAEMRLAV